MVIFVLFKRKKCKVNKKFIYFHEVTWTQIANIHFKLVNSQSYAFFDAYKQSMGGENSEVFNNST